MNIVYRWATIKTFCFRIKCIDNFFKMLWTYQSQIGDNQNYCQYSCLHIFIKYRKAAFQSYLNDFYIEKSVIQSLIMQQKQVLELIETVVKPLREKIQHLEKQNQMLKTQLNIYMRQSVDIKRGRSKSKQQKDAVRKEQYKEVRSPSLKKKEDKGDKPVWNYAKPSSLQVKSPAKEKYIAPRPNQRPVSKQKIDTDKAPSEKKITGGKRCDQISNANSNQGKTPQNELSSQHGEEHLE